MGEKKTLEAFVNMVLVVTIHSKIPKEVVFGDWEPLKGKTPQEWKNEEEFQKPMVDTIRELQREIFLLEMPTIPKKIWSMEWARPPFAINHPSIIIPLSTQTIILMVFEDLGEQFMGSKYIMTLGQLLQLILDLETYF